MTIKIGEKLLQNYLSDCICHIYNIEYLIFTHYPGNLFDINFLISLISVTGGSTDTDDFLFGLFSAASRASIKASAFWGSSILTFAKILDVAIKHLLFFCCS